MPARTRRPLNRGRAASIGSGLLLGEAAVGRLGREATFVAIGDSVWVVLWAGWGMLSPPCLSLLSRWVRSFASGRVEGQ